MRRTLPVLRVLLQRRTRQLVAEAPNNEMRGRLVAFPDVLVPEGMPPSPLATPDRRSLALRKVAHLATSAYCVGRFDAGEAATNLRQLRDQVAQA